jgi:hypothetical protein
MYFVEPALPRTDATLISLGVPANSAIIGRRQALHLRYREGERADDGGQFLSFEGLATVEERGLLVGWGCRFSPTISATRCELTPWPMSLWAARRSRSRRRARW